MRNRCITELREAFRILRRVWDAVPAVVQAVHAQVQESIAFDDRKHRRSATTMTGRCATAATKADKNSKEIQRLYDYWRANAPAYTVMTTEGPPCTFTRPSGTVWDSDSRAFPELMIRDGYHEVTYTGAWRADMGPLRRTINAGTQINDYHRWYVVIDRDSSGTWALSVSKTPWVNAFWEYWSSWAYTIAILEQRDWNGTTGSGTWDIINLTPERSLNVLPWHGLLTDEYEESLPNRVKYDGTGPTRHLRLPYLSRAFQSQVMVENYGYIWALDAAAESGWYYIYHTEVKVSFNANTGNITSFYTENFPIKTCPINSPPPVNYHEIQFLAKVYWDAAAGKFRRIYNLNKDTRYLGSIFRFQQSLSY
ncbi:hypothetical protein BVY04_03750 [bacterium M21]|nr:hypothetical protein BVY04_03750 [bacterium M21]